MCTSVPRPSSRQRNTSDDGSWEREVQAFVREPPWRTAVALLVFDGDELVAVAHYDVCAPDAFEVQVIAVSLARQGEGIGGQVLDHLRGLAAGGAASAGAEHVTLLARVHPENRASRRLMVRAGFEGWAKTSSTTPCTSTSPPSLVMQCSTSARWCASAVAPVPPARGADPSATMSRTTTPGGEHP